MRNLIFSEGEYYHVFNRGVERRDVFLDAQDLERFIAGMLEFNASRPIGSLYELNYRRTLMRREKATDPAFGSLASKSEVPEDGLVTFLCYCLNPNHFYILLRQDSGKGVQKFMQKIGTGYTKYFNEKYRREGSLFQGTYKTVHIETNEQLLYVSAYVNLNNQFGSLAPKLSRSSWGEYVGASQQVTFKCAKAK